MEKVDYNLIFARNSNEYKSSLNEMSGAYDKVVLLDVFKVSEIKERIKGLYIAEEWNWYSFYTGDPHPGSLMAEYEFYDNDEVDVYLVECSKS